jgi:hypothetical protein
MQCETVQHHAPGASCRTERIVHYEDRQSLVDMVRACHPHGATLEILVGTDTGVP